jgi:hypothetical protein
MLRVFPLGLMLGLALGWSLFRSFAPLLFGPVPLLKQAGYFWGLCLSLSLIGAACGAWAQRCAWIQPDSRVWKLVTLNFLILSCLLSSDPTP